MARIDSYWYRGSLWLWLLSPLSLLFCLLVILRRSFYRIGLLPTVSFSVPVVVVGNITVGGSGKTPLVTFLIELLREQGYKPGVVSRGYGGHAESWPQSVTSESDAATVGDEALLLLRRCDCPMVVGPDRVAAVEQLIRDYDIDVVISDDGLQHYRMGRDIEIAVLDGERRLANGLCLPAGPLREGRGRLKTVDFIVTNGTARAGEWGMQLLAGDVRSLVNERSRTLAAFVDKPLHAVAAIGNPGRFYRTLQSAGLSLIEHSFVDHHPFAKGELDFDDGLAVMMTEKDAVKYFPYANERHWYLPVTAKLDDEFSRLLLERLEKLHG
ncbi:MAG: tetraacyldisaccharide 4'-kinase [Pseudomonadota bacterium]